MGDDTDTHTVRVHDDTWTRLHLLKGPGDSFNDIIEQALDESDMKSDLVDRLKEEDETEAKANS